MSARSLCGRVRGPALLCVVALGTAAWSMTLQHEARHTQPTTVLAARPDGPPQLSTSPATYRHPTSARMRRRRLAWQSP